MLDVLMVPFDYQFMQKAIIVCTLIGIICALLSSFLILNHWSLIGDALSHSVVPGVVIAYWLSLPFVLGAFFSGLIAAFAMLFINKISKFKQDVVIGFVFSGFFALGLLMISIKPIAISVQTIIMGTIYSISHAEFWQIIIVFVAAALIIYLIFPTLVLILFDKKFAQSLGIKEFIYKSLFFSVLSGVIVISLQAVGSILVIALLIIPGACGFLITKQINRLVIYSMLVGGITAFVGAYLSYFMNIPAGPLIVLLQGAMFFIIFICKNGLYRDKLKSKLANQ
ncbi:metal ABC transporter permease [Thorsellia kenyensis]|uniref:Metal ABC transporter permease n=1 Tax=Thorsellia kenyensis TaxID=1549888 RepID=A0ABV6CA70_9GAMM